MQFTGTHLKCREDGGNGDSASTQLNSTLLISKTLVTKNKYIHNRHIAKANRGGLCKLGTSESDGFNEQNRLLWRCVIHFGTFAVPRKRTM